MKVYEKEYKYSHDKVYKGTKRGFFCNISNSIKGWYFFIHNDDKTISYNSKWDDLYFNSLEEATEHCENYIMKIIKGEKK